ncbi:O-antigen ligase family protein [Leptospira perdikensis]|uniref:O-antigen ligase domain-containing protein n=1 Tax=Leptospira perdikensis TaxID=2484948 RepID=A0A4R9JEY9_9LEPT|nr:O-antigen ligase family protein [Leptospira perdikensis]TGL37137.1 O-antigen ligase domain-containing protein [Leptospira perdikensis]
MKRILLLLFDFLIFFGFLSLFFGETNQKFFRNDAIGLGFFLFTIYFVWNFKKKKNSFSSLFHLLFVILLSNFVFFKLAEYDPIQLLPEKLAIKLFMFFWSLGLIYLHSKYSEKEFFSFGSILAILPCFVTSNFMSYPVIPIGFALVLTIRHQELIQNRINWLLLVGLAIFLYWIVRDWYDDFALIRIILLFEVLVFVSIARTWREENKQIIVDGLLWAFLINAVILSIKMFLEPNFSISSYREDLFLIPVSLIGSNSFLVLGLAVYSMQLGKRYKNLFYFVVLLFASFLLMISVSRISILSVGLLVFLTMWNQRSNSVKKVLLVLAVPIALLYILFSIYSEKMLLDMGTIGIRLSIWKLHFFSTLTNAPILGLGFNPEKVIPFLDVRYLSIADFEFVKDYMIHFHTFPLAHNLYFQMFSSVGIAGVLVFFYFVFFYSVRFVKKYNQFLPKERLLVTILFIWLIHEFLDFSSLEVANVFFLGITTVCLLHPTFDEDKNIEKVNPFFSKIFLTISFSLLLLFSIRFGFVEQSIFKYYKYVQLSSFYEFQSKTDSSLRQLEDQDSDFFENWKIRFLGERYFFLELALATGTKREAHLLVQCFETMPRKELCSANLMAYVIKQQKMENALHMSRYFLSTKDPFGIYTRDFL